MLQVIKKTIILYIILVLSFTAFLCLSYSLPIDSIKKNVAESALQIEKEGLWWKPCGFYFFQIDNMTDCLMLGTSGCRHEKNILQGALLAEHAVPKSDEITDYYYKITSITYQETTGIHTIPYSYVNYARYWHGYQIILKPLLCIFNYQQIRVINSIVLFLLMITIIVLLYRKDGKYAAITFGLTLVICNFFIVPLALQFSTCFYLAFIAMILFLNEPKWLANSSVNQALVFFSIGACTSYFDLLTTPLITLAFPLIVLLIAPQSSLNPKSLAQYCLWWGMGYASLWMTKWVLAWAFTDFNVIEDAIQAAQIRMGNTLYFGGKEMSFIHFFKVIQLKVQSIVPIQLLYVGILLLIIGAILFIWRNLKFIRKEKLLVCVLFAPLICFLILKNHSIQHIFFTWRNYMITLWCFLILMYKKNNSFDK